MPWINTENISGFMKLYQKSVRFSMLENYGFIKPSIIVPKLTDICLKLSKKEIQQGNLSGTVATLMEGLAIEQSQYIVR